MLYFVCFLPLKLEPNVPLRGWEEGACPTDADETPADRKQGDVHCWCVCVFACVHECVCQCVNGQLVNTFLGTKLFQPVLWGNVQMLCGLAKKSKKKKKRADVSVLTREWKNCPYPCVIVVPFKHVWSNRGDPHKHQLTGRAARSLSVTCVTVKISGVGSAADADSWIVSGKNKNAKATKKHCSQNENRLNLQESQLELNCESGITLYIKKKKTISLYLLSLFSPSVLIYDLVWEIRFVAGVLFFQFL